MLKLDQPAISRPTTRQAADGEEVEQADVEVLADEPGRERDDQQGHRRWQEGHDRGQREDGTSTPVGVKSSLERTLRPWTTLIAAPHGPTRFGPTRRFMRAMTFSSR